MSTSWKTISAEEAKAHPLYGIKNWLAVFALGVLFVPVREFGNLRGEAHKAGVTVAELLAFDQRLGAYIVAVLFIETIMLVVIYWLLFTKNPRFRNVVSAVWIASWPLMATVASVIQAPGTGAAVAMGAVPWALSCLVWVTYLQRSRRVRVTFEHQIRFDDPVLETTIHPGSGAIHIDSLPPSPIGPSAITKEVGAAGQSRTAAPDFPGSPLLDEEELWAFALLEFESQNRRPGLWARSFSESGGNESVAKASYLGSRVVELRSEREAQRSEHERQKRQIAQQERLATLSEAERAYAVLPKGQCPNCGAVLPIGTEECPKCKALFTSASAWKLLPLQEA